MNPLLADLVRHQAWADAESWRAVERCPAALADAALKARLHHLHVVQHAFLWTVRADGSLFKRTSVDNFAELSALKQYGHEATAGFIKFIESTDDEQLTRRVTIAWFKDPPLTIPTAEALVQAVMHSQWHRGQNATRLREVGGDPPMVDFIMWLWKGRPTAQW